MRNNLKTTLVSMRVWDLDYLKDSKRIALEMWIRATIDELKEYLTKKIWLNYSSKIYISVSPFATSFEAWLLWIQSLVNQGYKSAYKTHNIYNVWTK